MEYLIIAVSITINAVLLARWLSARRELKTLRAAVELFNISLTELRNER